MIRHMFFGKVKEGVPDAQIDELVTRWRGLAGTVASIRAITAGRNAHATDHRFSVALVADFDDWAGWKAYNDHPLHDEIRRELSAKIIDPDEKASIQLEL
jgi:hypothetical protein